MTDLRIRPENSESEAPEFLDLPPDPASGALPRLREFSIHSIRTRLLLWNVGSMAFVLAVLGGLISYTVRTNLLTSVDNELVARTARMKPMPPRPPQDGAAPPGEPEQAPPPREGSPDEVPEDPPPAAVGNGSRNSRTETERALDDAAQAVRIPLVLNVEGKSQPPLRDRAPWDGPAFARGLQGELTFNTIEVNNEPVRLISRPLYPPGPRSKPNGVVQAIYPLTAVFDAIGQMNQTMLTLIPVGLLLAGAGGAWMTDRALRPIRRITHTTAQIGAQNLAARLPVTGSDEFSELSGTINGMLARLNAAFGRMAALMDQQRQFTADASHELKTPLTIIKANASLCLATNPTPEEYRESMQEIDKASSMMSRLVQDLLLLARADEGHTSQKGALIEVGPLLEEAVNRLRRPNAAVLTLQTPEYALFVRGNQDELSRVFTNLIENALRHTPPEGRVHVSVCGTAGGVAISVQDTGIGIAPQHLAHLCERFYRVDSGRARSEGGSGLGLAICKSLVEAHSGRMRFASQVGKGTLVTVTLPHAGNFLTGR